MVDTGLVWFRNDLRIQDNTSLCKAVSNHEKVIAIYFFDPRHYETNGYGFKKTEKYRAKFLLETVNDLKKNLEQLNISLFLYHQHPEDVLPQFLEGRNISKIYLQKEWTQEESDILNTVKKSTARYHLEWLENYDQFLFHPDDVPFEIDQIPQVFTNFRKKCEKLAAIRPSVYLATLSPENKAENNTNIPQLVDLGYQEFRIDSRSAFPFKGGENQALLRIDEYFWQSKKLSYYKKTRNGLVGENYSSKLSAWLANGSISSRTIYNEVKKYEQQVDKNDSTYWLIFELIWRDFFKYISLKHRNNIFKIDGILNKEYEWKIDKKLIERWVNGETSEPFVNANMIELKNTGWMSNRGRQNVASYFAKELKLDWRIGAAYFESLLIDYDVHSNYGNWLYVSGVGNDPRDRKFNVQLQSERYDPQYKFQNLWLQPTLF
ncbi:DASH family cryptochrome [Aquimarina sp. MMG016]|uniref:DASH family cryptochrome n=1 Tax=Aquimarina sp. MMG016 TaxID=2822690 RepID=UPI001B39F02A|nr:DASH family cryptochrome [Aquimarina sp. MMG016]MBQ4820408.1 DASH family cryptochrome [Aquimarina sp. MMG016]